jgi:hypothetical protein
LFSSAFYFLIVNNELTNKSSSIYENCQHIISGMLTLLKNFEIKKESKIQCLKLIYNLLFQNYHFLIEFFSVEMIKLLKEILNNEVQLYNNRTNKKYDFEIGEIILIIHIFKVLIRKDAKFIWKVIDFDFLSNLFNC